MVANVLLITITIIFISVPFSAGITGSNTSSTACSTPYSCGSFKEIGYPFWGANRPKSCGHPDFYLFCYPQNNHTYITIPPFGLTKVISINNISHKMNVVLETFRMPTPLCQMMNMTNKDENQKEETPPTFRFNPTIVTNLTLFYGCTDDLVSKYQPKSFVCSNNDGKTGSLFHFRNMSSEGKESEGIVKSCKSNFSVPVFKKDLDELDDGNTNTTLLGVLLKGVELEYVVNFSACSACQSSGGRCGSSDNSSSDFACYCPEDTSQSQSQSQSQSLNTCLKAGRSKLFISRSGRRKSLIIGSVAAASGLSAILLILLALVIYSRRRRSINVFTFLWTGGTTENHNVEAFLKSYGSLAPERYTYTDIKKMTDSFKDRLGEGGYGRVYKGELSDGRFVAVKVLKKLKGNGEEFINEVLSISRTNHVNVVTLLGFCFERKKQALVYEFMPNGSLEKYIQGSASSQPLTHETLLNIVIGIARGLDYLHRGCNTRILHFDIKPHNILLDEKFCPKISDFGLARLFPKEQSHISTLEARGTIGYIAPEVFCRNFGGVSHKSDVYSFGMMIIDMVCGRKNVIPAEVESSSDLYFPQWIYNQLQVEEESELHRIMSDEETKLQRKMILVGLWCIQTYPSNRPSMNEVLEMLEGSLESLQIPPKPDLSSPSRSVAFDSSSTTQLTP